MKPTFLRVGVPRSVTRAPATVLPPTDAQPVTRGTACGDTSNFNETTHTITFPSGALAGDLCLAFVQMETGPITAGPSGWTEEYAVTANAGNDYAYLYTKTLTAADITAGSTTFTVVGSEDSGVLTHYFRGVDRTDLTISGPVGMDTAEHDPPAVTPSQGAGDYTVIVVFHENKGQFPTDQDTDGPTGYTSWCNAGPGGLLEPELWSWYATKSITTSENPSEIGWSDSAGSRQYATVTISVPTGGDPQVVGYPVQAGDVDSESATDGQVLTADGSGGAAWEDSNGVTNGDSHDHSGGDGAQIDHGSLAGLADDDHTQYLLADGTRALSGEWSAGSNKITNVTDPTADQDAATKAYVDANSSGEYWEVIVSGSAPPVAVSTEADDDWVYGQIT